MTFKISKYNKKNSGEKKAEEKIPSVFNGSHHGEISMEHVKNEIEESEMSESEKSALKIDKRIIELEKIGIKRGVRRKIFSVIGITFMFIVSLCSMYLCFILLSDIIDIVEILDSRIVNIADIEIRKNIK